MDILVHFIKAQHISRLHYQSVSGVLLPLSSQPEFSVQGGPTRLLHWEWKKCPWHTKPWTRSGFTKGRVQDSPWGAVGPHLSYPRARQTHQLLRFRSFKLLFSFLDPRRILPLTFTDAGPTIRKSAVYHRRAGPLRAICPQIITQTRDLC